MRKRRNGESAYVFGNDVIPLVQGRSGLGGAIERQRASG